MKTSKEGVNTKIALTLLPPLEVSAVGTTVVINLIKKVVGYLENSILFRKKYDLKCD